MGRAAGGTMGETSERGRRLGAAGSEAPMIPNQWYACLLYTSTSRVKSSIRGLWPAVFVSLFASSIVVAFVVVEGVIHADPWYNARQLVPIAGMIIGNAMSATAVAIDRLFADMDSRSNEVFALVALGATPKEAAFPSIKAAVGAGMTPILASMSAAGIVTIPGMMAGQLLAGRCV